MPVARICTEVVHDVMPTTVPSTFSSPPRGKSKETSTTIQDGDAANAEGSISGGLSPTNFQSAPEKSSILRPASIEDVPVINDPLQWSQSQKVGGKVTRSAVLVLIAATARCTCHYSLCITRAYFSRFHLPT
jgi:hypothetical protein